MIERVGSSKTLHALDWIWLGRVYADWCEHFKGEDGRIMRRLAEQRPFGPNATTITIDLEWGRETAPIKLVTTLRSSTDKSLVGIHTNWFDRSVDGMSAAIDRAEQFFAVEAP
jgi:hypothetical protein